jgi:hypothetical protein
MGMAWVGRSSDCLSPSHSHLRLSALVLSRSHTLSPYRSIDLSTQYPSPFIVSEQAYIIHIGIYSWVYLYRFLSPSLSPVPIVYTHTLAHAREFSNKEVYIYIYVCVLYIYDLTNHSSYMHITYDRNLGAYRKEKHICTRKKEKEKRNKRASHKRHQHRVVSPDEKNVRNVVF